VHRQSLTGEDESTVTGRVPARLLEEVMTIDGGGERSVWWSVESVGEVTIELK